MLCYPLNYSLSLMPQLFNINCSNYCDFFSDKMVFVRILLFHEVNVHEFLTNRVKLLSHPKILSYLDLYLLPFPNTLLLVFGLLELLPRYFAMFFLRFNPNFCKERHIAVRLTQFPVFTANNSHNSTIVAS